jgi:hypothetical protein
VHEGTSNKWLHKLDADREKLACGFRAGVSTLHLILLASSTKNIQTAREWKDWLNLLKCWHRTPMFESMADLPPDGQIVIRGWASSQLDVL